MVIAALITNYWKNSHGVGVKTYLVHLVDALQKKGVDICVLFREGNDPEHFYRGKNKVAFTFASYRQLRKIHPEVIYSQGPWYCLLPGVLYKKLNGCMLVHTFHTEPSRGLPLPAKIFFQALLNSCDCVTFVSKKLMERVAEKIDLLLRGREYAERFGSSAKKTAGEKFTWEKAADGYLHCYYNQDVIINRSRFERNV